MDYEKKIEIPFGAHDSELKGWEYTIPEGMEAEIKGGKVIVREKESEDGKFRKYILRCCKECIEANDKGLELSMSTTKKLLDYLEKQKEKEKYDRLQPVYDNLDSFDSALAKAWKAYNQIRKMSKEYYPKLNLLCMPATFTNLVKTVNEYGQDFNIFIG